MQQETDKEINQVIASRKGIKVHQSVVDCYKSMAEKAEHGQAWKSEELAELLQCKPNTRVFGLRLAAVNRQLETEKGFHLTSRGKNGLEFFVEDVRLTARTVKKMQEDGVELFLRSASYATAVLREHGDKMNDMERYKLEKLREIGAKRYILSTSIKSTITRKQP